MEEVTISVDQNQTTPSATKKESKLSNLTSRLFKHKFVLLSIILVFIVLLSAGGAFGYIILTGKKEVITAQYELLKANGATVETYSTYIPDPPEVKEYENPLNGELLTKKEFDEMKSKPVVVVMVNNHVAARPQSGLDKADIVYEALAEGGITRNMAVFWGPASTEATEVGPIRSIRQYFVDWAIEYKVPVVMHIGWAGYDPGIDKTIVPEADARSYILSHSNQLKSLQSGFWRDPNRVSPHNAYNSVPAILETAKKNGWGNEGIRDSYQFKPDASLDDRSLTSKAEITFLNSSANDYSVRWEYDKDSNTYLRYIGGVKHIDKITGKQLTAKNIVLQEVKYQSARDEHARILLGTVGTGKARYMIDGKVQTGTWKKADKTSMTKFYDDKGAEIKFNRGQLWIEEIPISPNDGKVIGKLDVN
ncbi:DUF3048 domain-containing protein [Candidatus Dojkabacteria bacterium]|uniref:DUF3048 domain-containing protein n=1 Tax=Candidatus Dojkabacteria bacterium TaxID=2099670 RepID=A0A955L2W0_9BACT|nr:DUF3048 domain-containing protein [Candidatus Dojkabacteria bacterium]